MTTRRTTHSSVDTELKTYNVCAYENGCRIMKELLEAANTRDAILIGKHVLKANGFTNLKRIRLEVIHLD